MNITKEKVKKLLDFVEAYAGVSPEHECATILRGLSDAEPVRYVTNEEDAVLRRAARRGATIIDRGQLIGGCPSCGRQDCVARSCATSPQATPQPTPPAECKNGCPPLQICDFCQGTGGKDKPPQAAQTEAKRHLENWAGPNRMSKG